jgi:hypothetical protein
VRVEPVQGSSQAVVVELLRGDARTQEVLNHHHRGGALSSTQAASDRKGRQCTMNMIRQLHQFLYNHGRLGRILELILILAFFVALLIPLWLWLAYQAFTIFTVKGAP